MARLCRRRLLAARNLTTRQEDAAPIFARTRGGVAGAGQRLKIFRMERTPGRCTTSYDAAGNLTLMQDCFGGVLTSMYDGLDRRTSRQFGGTGQTPLRFDLGYNNRNDITSVTRYSNLAGTATVGYSSYAYDSVNRVTNIEHQNGTGGVLDNYAYAHSGRATTKEQKWRCWARRRGLVQVWSTKRRAVGSRQSCRLFLSARACLSPYPPGSSGRLTGCFVPGRCLQSWAVRRCV